jgi:hypothetical protein
MVKVVKMGRGGGENMVKVVKMPFHLHPYLHHSKCA